MQNYTSAGATGGCEPDWGRGQGILLGGPQTRAWAPGSGHRRGSMRMPGPSDVTCPVAWASPSSGLQLLVPMGLDRRAAGS